MVPWTASQSVRFDGLAQPGTVLGTFDTYTASSKTSNWPMGHAGFARPSPLVSTNLLDMKPGDRQVMVVRKEEKRHPG